MLVIVFGLPGSGKSFFAQRLSKEIQAVYLSSDRTRKELAASPHYLEEDKNAIYEAMLVTADEYLEGGKSVVADATFYLERWRRAFWGMSIKHRVPCCFIETIAQEPLIKKRVSQKRPDSDADYNVFLTVKAQFMPMKEPHLVLESKEDNYAEMLKQALETIFGKV